MKWEHCELLINNASQWATYENIREISVALPKLEWEWLNTPFMITLYSKVH